MSYPLVSVVIPNYNNGKYLEECVTSVINQTYPNIEIVIVDDASTDNSRCLIEMLAQEFNNIIYYFSTSNKGVSATRNIGFEIARGDYVTTLDSDDTYCPFKIEKEVEVAERHLPEKIISYSSINVVDHEMKEIKQVLNSYNASEGNIYSLMLYRLSPIPRDILIPKSLMVNDLKFDESMSLYEDWDFKLNLAKNYKFYYSHASGVNYRQGTSGLSSVDVLKHRKAMKRIFVRYNKIKGGYSLFYIANHLRFFSRIVRFVLKRFL